MTMANATPLLSLRTVLATVGVLVVLQTSPVAAADDSAPVVRLYTASDFPRLARGIRVPSAGEYTVQVWAPARRRWSMANDGQTITLTSREEGDDDRPAWQVLGSVPLGANERLKINTALPETRPSSAPAPKGKRAPRPAPRPVPAVLVLSTEAGARPARSLDLVRGRLDATAPPDDPRRTHVRTNQEGADFQPPATAQAWRDRARAVREQLLVSTGLWPMFPKTPLNPQVYGKIERDGYTIEKVVLETFPGFTLSGNLYRPTGRSGKLPAMLCPHGHWAEGRTQVDVQARCIRWAKLGCVVFMYDMVGYNDSKPFGHAFLNDRLRRWGLSLVTLQTWDSIRALDWLTTLPDVDPARIGCTGESGGGTQTFLLTAIDDRVKVAAPVVMVSDSFQGGCVCENCAGLRIGTDNVEFAALAAPRPLKLVGASGDWTAKTMTNAYPTIRRVYELMGTPDRISADVFDFPHNYNQTSRNAVYAFLGRQLLGIADAESTREGSQSPEKAADLLTFNPDHPAPSDRKSPAQLEDDLTAALRRAIDALAPADDPARWQAARAFLKTSLGVRVGLVNPTPAELAQRTVRRTSLGEVAVLHATVGRAARHEQIPVVLLSPPGASGRVTVIATARGKSGLLTDTGDLQPLVRELLDRKQSVVGFDPLLVGESFDAAAPAFHRPNTVHFECYNPALAADQMQDLATVIAWVRAQGDTREVSLIGLGVAGSQVLLARPALEGLARTAVNLGGFDPADGQGDYPLSLDLPGLLQFGGLKAAAALAAPSPLWLFRHGEHFARSWPERAYALADASRLLKVSSESPSPVELARWIDSGE
jgi:dienelactone hydrolase